MSKNGKSKKRKVNNQEDGKANIKNPNEPNREKEGLKFDFSFEALYYSVKLSKGKFNNYLRGEREFIDKFRQIRDINAKLKNKEIGEVRNDPRAHFHEVSGEERKIVINCVGHALSEFKISNGISENIAQLLTDEPIYQIGLNKGVRVIGTYNEETFRVYLIDYHHRLYYNQSKNTHGEKELTFCPMKSELT